MRLECFYSRDEPEGESREGREGSRQKIEVRGSGQGDQERGKREGPRQHLAQVPGLYRNEKQGERSS